MKNITKEMEIALKYKDEYISFTKVMLFDTLIKNAEGHYTDEEIVELVEICFELYLKLEEINPISLMDNIIDKDLKPLDFNNLDKYERFALINGYME